MENMTGGIKLEFWFAFLSLRSLDVFTGISFMAFKKLEDLWDEGVNLGVVLFFSRTNQGYLE